MAPQQRRQRTLEGLINQIVALAEQSPVLMIVEDIHWVDPTTLEALGRGIDRIKSVGVLLIMTYRPEFEPPWLGRPYVTALTLNRLGEREIAYMIDRVRGNRALPEDSAGHRRTHRRHSIVRGGNDESGTRGRKRRRSRTDCRCRSPLVLPSRRACMPHSWRGLIGSAPARKWRRSERR